MTPEIDSVIRIPCTLDIDFYREWLLFLKPLINLTNRECDIAAAILNCRYKLSKSITDLGILDEVTLSTKSYAEIQEECKIAGPHFNVVLNELRKKKFLLSGKRINPKCIPHVKDDAKSFSLLLMFDFGNDIPGSNKTDGQET